MGEGPICVAVGQMYTDEEKITQGKSFHSNNKFGVE